MERGPLLLAAAILAAAIVVGAMLVQGALERGTSELERVSSSLAVLETALQEVSGAPERSGPSDPERARRVSIRTDGAPTRGPEAARVTIVAFSDFQCPYCARARQTLEQVQEVYRDDVAVVFKHLPLRQHPEALEAHAAAEAAHRQGRFWEMHDPLYANPHDLEPGQLASHARQLGLDVPRFERDLASDSVRGRVEADLHEARQLGITGTPTFYVNGRLLAGAQPFETFQGAIDQELRIE